VHKPIFLGLGLFAAVIVIGAASVVGYIVSVANTAPSLESRKPMDLGDS